MRHAVTFTQVLALALTASPALADPGDGPPAPDRSAEVSVGVVYQEGDYGTGDRLETLSVPVSVTTSSGRLHLAASLPYLRTNAPADVIVSQGGLLGTPLFATKRTGAGRTTREGIGDLTVQAAVDLPVAGFAASVGTSLKLPTASAAKGLGTGKVDYAIGAQVARPMGVATPFASVGYTVVGEPAGFDVRNSIGASAGTRVNLGRRTFATASYSWEQAAVATLADRQAVGIGIGTALSDKVRISVQGDAGLSRSAPDASVAARIGFGF